MRKRADFNSKQIVGHRTAALKSVFVLRDSQLADLDARIQLNFWK
jgi:hypothetical protein